MDNGGRESLRSSGVKTYDPKSEKWSPSDIQSEGQHWI